MNRDEATGRIDALVQAHEELLEDLQRVRGCLKDGDYDSSTGRRELAMEVAVHTRKLWKATGARRDFELELFGRPDE